MSNQPVSKGRLIQVAQSYTNGGDIRKLESGEFGLGLDEGQERLWIGSNSGNLQVVTERNIAQLAVPDGSISRTELDGEVNTLLDSISSVDNMPIATTSQKGLMSSGDKVKLNSIEAGANNTVIVNNLTSLSTTSALSAYQGKLLKDEIENIVGGGSTVAVVDNLTSTDTASALSANQGRVIKGLIDNKAEKTTATTSSNGLMSASDKQKLDNVSNSGTTVVNSLTSASTTSALSANMGRELKSLIDNSGQGGKHIEYGVEVMATNRNVFFVALSTPMSDTNYGITVTTSWQTSFWVKDVQTNGFNIYFSNAGFAGSEIRWTVIK